MALPVLTSTSNRLDRSFLGRALKQGSGEAFGMQYRGGEKLGFLGLKDPNLAKRGMLGKVGTVGFGSLSLLGTVYSVYSGYQEEGVWGAAKGLGASIAVNTAISAATTILGGPVVWGAAAIAAGGYGYYRAGEAAKQYKKQVRAVEMGGGMHDVIGSAGAVTDRARALQALSNTHINARMALGNEALLTHSSYR